MTLYICQHGVSVAHFERIRGAIVLSACLAENLFDFTVIDQHGIAPGAQAKSQVIDAFEQAYLSDLIQRFGGNVSKAAREAGLDRHHLKDLLDKHGIETK